jgi:hypothetical protein
MIYSITTEAERNKLAELASKVPDQGVIVEVGTLYGGVTAVLAKAQPNAAVITIDNFSWHPEDMPVNSVGLVQDNLAKENIENVTIIENDSREVAKNWARDIDLLWIDGGHSYQFVYFDLVRFGTYSKVIALHDYKNPAWSTIEEAINVFLKNNKNFYSDEVVDMLIVLRRKE